MDYADRMASPSENNHDKIPSIISYSNPSVLGEQQFGHSLSPDSVAMIHTKLELDKQSVLGELDLTLECLDGMKNLLFQHIKTERTLRGMPPYTHKKPEKIIEEYLTKVRVRSIEYMDRRFQHDRNGDVRERFETDLILTVPTDWSYMAMNSTYKAMWNAGFNDETFARLRDVIFISEPEAAALFTARYLEDASNGNFLRKNSYFILCDAGGGTVDVVSYKIKQTQPTLQLERVGSPTGRSCGAIFINMKFKEWLRTKVLGEKLYNQLDPHASENKIVSHATEGKAMRELMSNFEALKRDFKRDHYDEEYHLELPKPLNSLDAPPHVNEGELTIQSSEMESFFDYCVDQVLDLIQGHFQMIDSAGGSLNNVLLVGGFGESDYLQKQIEFSLNLWTVQLRTPDTSWTAVLQGAVLCGIERSRSQNLRRATPCLHNYGISCKELFSEAVHRPQDMITDPATGLNFAEGQMVWVLNKGDLVLQNEERTVSQDIALTFAKHEEKKRSISIYMNSDSEEHRPKRFHADRYGK
ncbi:hypothetical protein EJ04DRAFT_513478 [Polyplosphaeria fusca]|uniref:Actin-like ATPase domain-containing protein n=1 Tax=Polyplosphaeria fusca TaxID=682080 RepID=A0A9P4QXG4_9PLEO|nr:hypothetical protein EJ04DRAFT_513478 [Polyplosphaeria fusca]